MRVLLARVRQICEPGPHLKTCSRNPEEFCAGLVSEIRSLSQGGSELLGYHEVIKQTLGINRKPFYTHAQHSHPIEKQSRPVSELYKPRARVIGDETSYRQTVFPRPSDVSDTGGCFLPVAERVGALRGRRP